MVTSLDNDIYFDKSPLHKVMNMLNEGLDAMRTVGFPKR